MLNRALVVVACVGVLLTGVSVKANERTTPVRSSTAGAVWSTSPAAFRQFVQTGVVADRGLGQLIARSGWTKDELRAAFVKEYPVDLGAVSTFLSSEPGVIWLRNQTRSYTPFASLRRYAPTALRSAILADARDGVISAAGIMAALPTDFRLTRGYRDFDGVQNVCAVTRCEDPRQCTSLLSWFYFLPACIQADAVSSAVDQAFDRVQKR
ncbi:protein phosphatase [Synechococcus sp. HK05]|uniref:protein phosphatase n=1 Tax=Synechococcus sp. HK05 TaxID=2725975 RepID=UPI0034CF4DA9